MAKQAKTKYAYKGRVNSQPHVARVDKVLQGFEKAFPSPEKGLYTSAGPKSKMAFKYPPAAKKEYSRAVRSLKAAMDAMQKFGHSAEVATQVTI